MKRAAQLAHVRQIASLELSGATIMPALLRAVREFVDAGSAGFFWVDSEGDMTNLYAERSLPPHVMKAYFEKHYGDKPHAFREKFLERARAEDPVSSSSPSAEFMKTPYYREILSLLEAHHVLYAVIREKSVPIGQLSLYRPRGAKAFSAADRNAIRDISHYIAAAAARLPQAGQEGHFIDGGDEGLVVTDARGQLVQGSASSLHLLTRSMQRSFNARTPPMALGDQVKGAAMVLVQRIEAQRKGKDTPPARENIDGQWGRFVLSAFALDGNKKTPGAVGIHIRRKEPFMMRLVEAMAKLDLSPQQREVALLLAQGKSNAEIAVALDVAANTANYHVKQLFARLDAHDRAEAVARIVPNH
ncbi:MAG: helix-turn-helix transcriptional regulator [Betaproteobacteria bacterium]|nr:helix-turn-helix transcriptional regulator [Betaproteobacteria bacterium]